VAIINTIDGPIEDSALERTIGVEQRPAELVVWVEWRRGDELLRRDAFARTWADVAPVLDLPRVIEVSDSPDAIAAAIIYRDGETLVSRSVWAIAKHPSVTADALAGGIG
jgi:hypothetical protein